MFVEICPQGDSIYSEIFQMCSCGPLRSQGILHQSHSGDWGVTACSGFPAGVPVSPDSLLLTRKDAWGHVGRKGGPRRTSEVTAHSRRGHRQGNTTQYSVTFKMINHCKMNTLKTIIISLSKPMAASVLKYLVLSWSQKPSWSISN